MMRALRPMDGTLLRYLVQRLPRPHHRRGLDGGFQDAFISLKTHFLPFNRNGVLFPEKINGMYMMACRPSDNGHTPFGDIYMSQSPDMEFWGRHRFMMGTIKGNASAWQSTKIGAGPTPIKTDEGWLMIYHGVLTSCSGYRVPHGQRAAGSGKALEGALPHEGLYHDARRALYERMGDVPNVVFPCAALTDADTGRIAVYYGCADTVTGLAFTTVEELVQYTKTHSC